MKITFQFFVHHAHATKGAKSVVLEANQVLLADDAGDVLLMCSSALLLPCLLLVSTTLALSLDASLGRLESLGLNQLSIANFLVLFLLVLHDGKLGLFKYFHAGLLERFEAEDIEHGLNLSIEIEKLPVVVEDLRLLAIFLGRHLRLEERHRGSVQVKLSGNANLLGRWLVCQVLDVLISLKAGMHTAMDGLRRGDVTVRVYRYNTLRCLKSTMIISMIRIDTYLGGRFECALAQALGLLSLTLLHDHSVV